MNAIFSMPLMFAAFSAVPVLAAIYLLRNRFRRHIVSSLMLWQDQKKAKQGGLNLSRIQTPLLFLLELLTIIMLVLAATGPLIRASRETRVFVIVLDNSFSMLADNGTTSRDRAIEDIKKLLADSSTFQARFILAGLSPELVGEPVRTVSQANDVLDNWNCISPTADLGRAVSLANQLAGQTARILVITDHKPDVTPAQGRIEYWAFGEPIINIAFVNAGRTIFEEKDRCFLAVANLSDEVVNTKLIAETIDDDKQLLIDKSLELEPNEIYRTFFEPEVGSSPIRARLENDSLNIDNEIILVAEPQKKLRVRLSIADEKLSSAVNKAVEAIKLTSVTSIEPHLFITDVPDSNSAGSLAWSLKISSDPNAVSYLGPFVVDYSHPLTEGLSLEGIVWGAVDSNTYTGIPVIAAGNIPLLTDTESVTGLHNITVNLNHELSTVLESPNWPILLWNVVQWRRSVMPGLSQSNIVLGSDVTLTKDSVEQSLLLTAPDNNTRDIVIPAKTVSINPDIPGLYKLATANSKYELAVNILSKSESDLTAAVSGKWGRWQQADLFWWEYRPVDWLFLLIALILLAGHRYIAFGQQKGVGI